MQLWTDLIDPAALTDFSRTIAEQYAAQDVFTQILPNTSTDDVKFSWNVNENLSELAEYRAFDAETPIGKGMAGERKTAELAALDLKVRFGEYDQLRRRAANSPETVQAAAERLAVNVARAVVDRVTKLKAEALLTGALAINENRFVQNVAFGRASGQTNAAPTALWSAASGADPIVDLLRWQDVIVDATGATPDIIVTSTRVYAALAAHLAGSDYVTTSTGTISREVVNEILVAYGLPAIVINNRKIGGVRVIADDKLIMAASSLAGATVWGTSVEADNPKYGLQSYGLAAPGLMVGAYQTEDPNTKWIRSDAIALPILAVPNATLSADVL